MFKMSCVLLCELCGDRVRTYKTSITFVMSVHPHGTTRLPLDGF